MPSGAGPAAHYSKIHVFKIRGGKIHEIEAMGFILPYGSKTGWE